MIVLPHGVASYDWTPLPWATFAQVFANDPIVRPPLPTPKLAKPGIPAWSPVELRPGGRRTRVDALRVGFIVLDYDDLPQTPGLFDPDGPLLGPWAPHARILHTSYSHTPSAPKARVVVRLADPVPADRWDAVWLWASTKCAHPADPKCRPAHHAYLVPAIQHDTAPYTSVVVPGELLRVDLASLPAAPPRASASPGSWTPSSRPPQAAVAVAHGHLVEALAAHVGEIAARTDGRRSALQRAAYLFGGYTWAIPGLRGDALAALREAAHRCGRWDDGIDRMLEETLDAGAGDPIPLDDVVNPVEVSDPSAPPTLVLYGASNYVLRPGDAAYDNTATQVEAVVRLRDRGDVVLTTAKGRDLPWTTIARKYGQVASDVVLAYPRPDGTVPRTWDPETRILTSTCAHTPAVAPQHHDDVAGWLNAGLSACDEATRERVLDWLVTSYDEHLDHPSACLYVAGTPGTGKSMLAAATASVWRSAPIPFGVALQQFNAALAKCPVIHLEEGTGSAGARKVNSEAFRELVAARAHTIEYKKGAVVTVASAVRGIVTANNNLALDAPDIATLADLNAIAERVLYVPWAPVAKAYLVGLGRRTAQPTLGWVTGADGGPGKIAQHIAYIAASRRVVPGTRWVVEGIPVAYHRNFLFRPRANRDFLDALCSALAVGRLSTDAARWTGDDVAVRLGAFVAEWNGNQPAGAGRYSRQELRDLIEGFAKGPPGDGVWLVDGAIVRAYAASLDLDIQQPTVT